MEYAKDYLEHLLSMEDVLGHNVNQRIDKMVEQRFRDYLEKENEKKKP